MSKALGFLTMLGLIVLSPTVRAFEIMDTVRVITIHGTVAADEKAAQKIGYDAVSIGYTGVPADVLTWVGVAAAMAFDGDAFEGRNILATLDGYTPNLLASGKADLIAKIRNAPSGSRLVVMGVLDPSRNFMVTTVKVVPAGNAP